MLTAGRNAGSRTVAGEMIEDAGYSTARPGSARSALALIAGSHFGRMVLEDTPGDMPGVHALHELRAQSSIPAVFCAPGRPRPPLPSRRPMSPQTAAP